jgi:hypothetical protein
MALVPCVKGLKEARHPATRVLDGGCKTSMGFHYSGPMTLARSPTT